MKCLIIIALFIACALASGSPLSFKEASRGLAEGGVTVLRQVRASFILRFKRDLSHTAGLQAEAPVPQQHR
jgi:hypothetical protein